MQTSFFLAPINSSYTGETEHMAGNGIKLFYHQQPHKLSCKSKIPEELSSPHPETARQLMEKF
jgi:hypothetical protein